MTTSKFSEVFKNLELSPKIANEFAGADVARISLARQRRLLSINLVVHTKIEPGCFKALEHEITAKFGALERVEVSHKSTVVEMSPPPPAPTAQKPAKPPANGYRQNTRGSGVAAKIDGRPRPLNEDFFADEEVLVEGTIFGLERRETKSGKLMSSFDIFDKFGAIACKFFQSKESVSTTNELLKNGAVVRIAGKASEDSYSREIVVMANKIAPGDLVLDTRADNAVTKRVELHLHTNMSQLDATHSATDYIKRAAAWGHSAVAITDHGVLQAYPEAMEAGQKAGIKVIYGVEAYIVDDLSARLVMGADFGDLAGDIVVFDVETTGLHKETCSIIEIGAVKIRGGEVVDTYNALIDPGQPLPPKITELTGITDNMLAGKPPLAAVLPDFIAFIGDCLLVAHNAPFDMGFLTHHARKLLGHNVANPYLCTVSLGRMLFPNLHNHKLNTLAKHLGVELVNHHRASDDAGALAKMFAIMLNGLSAENIVDIPALNRFAAGKMDIKRLPTSHAIILVKDQMGLRNLYQLVSESHLEYYFKRPIMPKSRISALREGLLIGTACEAGELYKAVKDGRDNDIAQIAEFYDFFEIQPIGNNMFMVHNGELKNAENLREINIKIVQNAQKYNKLAIAASDVHFLDPDDEVYRRMIMAGQGFKDADNQAPMYFRTTDEMLNEFDYLGKEMAYDCVITNTNLIADMIDDVLPIPKGTFAPVIPGSDEDLRETVNNRAMEIYGNPLPEFVEQRLNRELDSIIKNGFAVMYIIAKKLVDNSVENGYVVGSRGSVGSSFVATMAGITEVNPLPPHYYCPSCQFTDFDSDVVRSFAGGSGCDMPDKNCPNCQNFLKKDGHDIPFETFLGFDGDKEPDIDLNFSGEYQAQAHAYCEELFGRDFVFKAGTIGTIADKTAYGYVKKYLEERGRVVRAAEVNRLVAGCTGIKRTTGQHPGGLVVVPQGHSIYEFTPIQRPANDTNSDVITTHFDYHSIEGRLLKLDILGHDCPTIIRMLHDMTGVDPCEVDIGDKDVVNLFTTPAKLGVSEAEIGCKTGSFGLPEFGTAFVRQMLADTQPTSFAELARISGLSHGTDVWLNNGQDLIRQRIATLKEIIPTRDDIMVYLINKGVEKLAAFKIMESVRRGRGVTDEEEETMRAAGVPGWYIESCRKIKYMFPKGHAVAYVMMTMRIGYFKIHYPEAFYAATFSVKSEDFDYEIMCRGREVLRNEMNRINALGQQATQKEKNSLVVLELVNEMYARGIEFAPLDIYSAAASRFIVTDKRLMPPLSAVAGLGSTNAKQIVESRADGEFYSIEDFKNRTKTSKNVIELLKQIRALDGIPETDQLSLF